MRLIVATNNAGKLQELRSLLPSSVELHSLAEAGLAPPEETGDSFVANALIKARAAARAGDAAIADDSGLEVDALDGLPGIYSSRFAGVDAGDAANNAKLLDELARRPGAPRTARFRSAVALVTADGREFTATGQVEGTIIDIPRGEGGFGYDPLFEIHDDGAPSFEGRTMAELSLDEKNRVSHRSRAYRALLHKLEVEGIDLACH